MFLKSSIEGIGRTPLIELSHLSPKKKVKILAKLEGQNMGGSASIKDRVALYMVEKAEQSGQLTKDSTIIEATSGNTGIALAWLGAMKGYRVTIVMPESMSIERRQLMRIYKAELVLTEAARGVNGSIEVTREMAAKDRRYFMPDQFSNQANPLAHYEMTGPEILADFPYDKIDVLVCGVGTGGTICGLSRCLREKFPNIKVLGVEPPLGDPIQGLRCLELFIPAVMDLSLLTERTFVTSAQATQTTRLLAEKEGIFAGMSSGAAVYRAIQVAREMDEGNIVVVLPDGGWKYLSMDFWTKSEA